MKLEHRDILNRIQQDEFGEITFSRYEVATGLMSVTHLDKIFKEALQFLALCHQNNLETLYASRHLDPDVYLVTLQFQNQSLANLLIDGSPQHNMHYTKQIEMVGPNGIYQYNSLFNRGFSSDFLQEGNYQPQFQEDSLENLWLSGLVEKIQESIQTDSIIYLGGTL